MNTSFEEDSENNLETEEIYNDIEYIQEEFDGEPTNQNGEHSSTYFN